MFPKTIHRIAAFVTLAFALTLVPSAGLDLRGATATQSKATIDING